MEDYIAGRKVDVWKTGMCPNNIIFFLFNICGTASVSRIRESIDEERFYNNFLVTQTVFPLNKTLSSLPPRQIPGLTL